MPVSGGPLKVATMNQKCFAGLLLLVAACWFGATQTAPAWWKEGHQIVARAATNALPQEIPVFFRQSGDALAHFSGDPDAWKNRDVPHLRDAEAPEHFINWELLKGHSLPAKRWKYAALCADLDRNPEDVGFLPYAIVEGTERLAVAFADYRRSPHNPDVRLKCLVYGGLLSHYTADLAQPLHLTVDYDGRTSPGAPSPRTGIHNRMDALIASAWIEPGEIAAQVRPTVLDDLLTSIVQEIVLNRRAIDAVYALSSGLPSGHKGIGTDPNWRPDDRVREFARERAREAAFLTASVWLTAWEHSAKIAAKKVSPETANAGFDLLVPSPSVSSDGARGYHSARFPIDANRRIRYQSNVVVADGIGLREQKRNVEAFSDREGSSVSFRLCSQRSAMHCMAEFFHLTV